MAYKPKVLEITAGGTNVSTFTQSNGVVTYNGTSLVNYAGPQISSSGVYKNTTQPSFSATLSASVTNATGDGTAYTVAFDTEQYDQANNFSSNTFTAPVTGIYEFTFEIALSNLGAAHTLLNVTIGTRQVIAVNPFVMIDSSGLLILSGTTDFLLAANDTITMIVTVTGSTKTVTIGGTTVAGTFLTGSLLT